MTTSILSNYKKFYEHVREGGNAVLGHYRKQFAAGTEERVNADASYLQACQDYYDARKELDEKYRDDAKDINDDLIDNIKDLQNAYKDSCFSEKI